MSDASPPSPAAPAPPSTRVVTLALVAFLGIQALAHLAVAWRMTADYYDGFDYLINARFLAGHGDWFEGVRPPLVSILQLGFFAGDDPGTPWRGPHLLAIALSYLCLIPIFALLRTALGRTEALVALALFAASRIFVRYAPFVMGDILGTGLTAAALAFHLRGREPGAPRWMPVATGVAASLALLTRHPLGIVGPFLVGFEVFESLRSRGVAPSLRRVGFWVGVALPLPAFLAVMYGLLAGRMGWSVDETMAQIAGMVLSQADKSGITSRTPESTLEYVDAIATAWGPVVGLAIVAGLFLALARGSAAARLHALWFAGNLALFSLVISRRESRYLLPAIPSALVLAMLAVRAIAERLGSIAPLPRRVGLAALALGVAGPVLAGAWREHRTFDDPIYRVPFITTVAERAAALVTAPGRLVVVGDKYAVHPADPIFTLGDEYYYFHHVTDRTFDYLTDAVVTYDAERALARDGSLAHIGLLTWAAPGDVLVELEPVTYQALLLPGTKQPLRLARVALAELEATASGSMAGADCMRFSAPGDRLLSACPVLGGLAMATDEPGPPFELYVPGAERWESVGWFPTQPSGRTISLGDGPQPGKLLAAHYDAIVLACPPGTARAGVTDVPVDVGFLPSACDGPAVSARGSAGGSAPAPGTRAGSPTP